MVNFSFHIRDFPIGRLVGSGHRIHTFTTRLEAGQHALLVAPMGSGKTEFANCASGFMEARPSSGTINISDSDIYSLSPNDRAQLIGLVPSQPHLLFSCFSYSLLREMELSYEFLGRKLDHDCIKHTAQRFGIEHLLSHPPLSLSGGEMIKAAIALVLLKLPAVTILDESFNHLDPRSELEIRAVLDSERAQRGMIVVETHARPRISVIRPDMHWIFVTSKDVVQGPLAHCWQNVSQSDPEMLPPFPAIGAKLQASIGVTYSSPPISAPEIANLLTLDHQGNTSIQADSATTAANLCTAIEVNDLTFSYHDNSDFHLGPLSFDVRRGSATAILGRNGAGKTTLLRCLGNVLRGWEGGNSVFPNKPHPNQPLHQWARSILYCFQDPDDQLFLGSVRAELLLTAKHTRADHSSLASDLQRLTHSLGLSAHLDDAPADLPRPLRRVIALGGALLAAPSVLLLDEPTVDLDADLVAAVFGELRLYVEGGGTAVIVSHDYDFVADVADALLILDHGRISAKAKRGAGISWPGEIIPSCAAVAHELGVTDSWGFHDLVKVVRASTRHLE